MVLSEQTWELVLLLVKAEQWDYLELTHECCTVGSDNLKGADFGGGEVACVSWPEQIGLGDVYRGGRQRDTSEIRTP